MLSRSLRSHSQDKLHFHLLRTLALTYIPPFDQFTQSHQSRIIATATAIPQPRSQLATVSMSTQPSQHQPRMARPLLPVYNPSVRYDGPIGTQNHPRRPLSNLGESVSISPLEQEPLLTYCRKLASLLLLHGWGVYIGNGAPLPQEPPNQRMDLKLQ